LAWPVIANAAKSERTSKPIAKYVLAVARLSAISFIVSRFKLFEAVLRNIFLFSLCD
jgi:hypothetical protein